MKLTNEFRVGQKYFTRPYCYDHGTFLVFKVISRTDHTVIVEDQDYHGTRSEWNVEVKDGVERFKPFGMDHYDLEDYITKATIDLTITADTEIPEGSPFDMLVSGCVKE